MSSKKNKNNVVKFHKARSNNLGAIMFFIILVYLLIHVIAYFNKPNISIYEVQSSYIDNNVLGEGLIIRNEKILTTEKAGYLNYYIREGEKVSKGATVYTIDETGSVYELLSESAADASILSTDDYNEIRETINDYKNYYDNNEFSDIYNFKYDLNNTVLELSNEMLFEQLYQGNSINNSDTSFVGVNSIESGIVSYIKDGYEDINFESNFNELFTKKNYDKKTMKSEEMQPVGSSAYKIVTSENWNIIMPISAEDSQKLVGEEYVDIIINRGQNEIACECSVFQQGEDTYVNLTLNKLMIDYLTSRFLDIEIVIQQEDGLKIPNSSFVDKSVLMIPISYLSLGSDSSSENNFNLRVLDENGNLSIVQISPDIYKKDEEFCYVDPNDFELNAAIVPNNSDEVLAISSCQTTTLKGVYCVNKGVATFKLVDVISSNDDYSIIRTKVEYSLSMYDRIILDSTTIGENELIY